MYWEQKWYNFNYKQIEYDRWQTDWLVIICDDYMNHGWEIANYIVHWEQKECNSRIFKICYFITSNIYNIYYNIYISPRILKESWRAIMIVCGVCLFDCCLLFVTLFWSPHDFSQRLKIWNFGKNKKVSTRNGDV